MAATHKQIADFGSITEIASHVFDSNTQRRIQIQHVIADDITTFVPEPETSAIKETLQAQQQLLQKLYNELEAEREASETAANEALSVILRLQGEKAAIKMEAEQYKRLSEDRICQMEDSLAVMQELIYHKEMEVAALDHQLQAYRCKPLNMGCFDHEEEGRISNRELLCNKASDFDNLASESDSYWDMIKGLDDRVRDIVGVNYPHSSSPQLSLSTTSASDIQFAVSNQTENSRIHDVFEVPQMEKRRVIVSHKPPEESGKKTDGDNDAFRSRTKNVPLVQPRSEIERVDGSGGSNGDEQQLILLKQIKEQVSSLQEEFRRWKANQSTVRDEQSLETLQEAMLYFWL